jgi:O-antigen ligase
MPFAATLCMGAGALMAVGAPLIRGGNRGVALIALEWLALVVLVALAWLWAQGERSRWGSGAYRWGVMFLITSPLWVALLQLAPLPLEWWVVLPGRSFYQDVQVELSLPQPSWRPASLLPDMTRVSVLAGLPVVACLALGITSGRDQMKWLLRLWVGGAVFQALLGLAQISRSEALYFDSFFKGVIGTFANSNHFAGFLAMSMPLVVWEMKRALDADSWRSRKGGAIWFWGGVLLVMFAAVVATHSRAGLALAIGVASLAVLLLPGRTEGLLSWRWRLLLLAGVVVVALFAAGAQGLRDFTGSSMVRGLNARQAMFSETWAAAQVFWPVGSGLGTFAGIYPRFQAGISGRDFVEHAHSDYVQLLMEVGALGLLLGVVALVMLLGQAIRLGRKMRHGLRSDEEAMLAAGLGLLALLLHAWVDFNMRIPALAMFGAFLMGVFMRQSDRWQRRSSLL